MHAIMKQRNKDILFSLSMSILFGSIFIYTVYKLYHFGLPNSFSYASDVRWGAISENSAGTGLVVLVVCGIIAYFNAIELWIIYRSKDRRKQKDRKKLKEKNEK